MQARLALALLINSSAGTVRGAGEDGKDPAAPLASGDADLGSVGQHHRTPGIQDLSGLCTNAKGHLTTRGSCTMVVNK